MLVYHLAGLKFTEKCPQIICNFRSLLEQKTKMTPTKHLTTILAQIMNSQSEYLSCLSLALLLLFLHFSPVLSTFPFHCFHKKKKNFKLPDFNFCNKHFSLSPFRFSSISDYSSAYYRWPSNLPSVLLKSQRFKHNSFICRSSPDCLMFVTLLCPPVALVLHIVLHKVSCFIRQWDRKVSYIVHQSGVCSEQVTSFVSPGFLGQALVLSRGCGCIFKPFL